MPWTAADAKRFKKGLTSSQASKWASIANAVLKQCKSQGSSNCEGKAIRIANSKFSNEGFSCEERVDINSTWTQVELALHDEYFGLAAQKRAGGSNAGKYKTGPFCGPSGGAPKGTYPVNTKARAVAALAYARHAPNPSGIRACVCRHWSSLPACKRS
jgi:hypothetical protein